MGLASKLQAAQQMAGPLMATAMPAAGGPPGAAPGPGPSPYPSTPGVSPYPAAAPPGGSFQPSAPPIPQGGGNPSPYPYPPTNAFGGPTPAAPGAAAPGGAHPQQPGQQPLGYPPMPGYQQMPGHQQPMPGFPQPQQQPQQARHVMPQAMPYPVMPGVPGAMPAQQQQQQLGGLPPYPQQQPQQHQQQQQMTMMMGAGAPPGAAAAAVPAPAVVGGAPGGMAGVILNKLNSIVAANQLQRFYNPQALQSLATRLDSRVNFRDLAVRWQMPVELALDLSALALYDCIIFADDSGSMAFEENGERIDDLKLIGSKVAEVATLFDDDGILMRFMNSPTEGNGLRSPQDVAALLANVQYSGLTPLATSLQTKVLQPIVYSLAATGQLQKPVLVITITDGEPTDNPKDLVVQVIKDARHRLAAQYGPKVVAFEFAQVGKDQRAQAFLGRLDQDPEVGGSIDCTSYFEMESQEYQRRGIQLSPSMWLVKMMVGSIDPSYDEGDE